MKAHGVTSSNNGGGGRAGSAAGSGPSNSTTPSRKTPVSGKKRKLAASSDDVDDIKSEIKDEIKQEANEDMASTPNGSYMMHPIDSHFDVMAETLVNTGSETYSGDNNGLDDEVFVVAEARRDYSEPTVTPVALVQQMFAPPPPETFYGFVDHYTGPLQQHPSQAASTTPAALPHDQDADCSSQTVTMSNQVPGNWLHHQGFYWNN